ncbi:MAG: glycosyltransferase, partial [Synechococcaceae bacterium WB7_3xG_012]|nr:glycosyltransferase [Synechococcaceae bacterium WB7_3xG_012]
MQMVWCVLGLGFCLRLLLAALIPPGYDEAYYVFYGRQLDLSYFDHPVAVGIWSWAGQQLGSNTLALRLPSLLSYTAALALLADATKRWYGKAAQLWLVLLGSSCPLLFICGGVLLLPDSPLL